MKYAKIFLLVPFLFLALSAESCANGTSEADKQMERETRQAMEEAHAQVGMPDIVNFQERRWAKMILELRDEAITTYTYTVDMNGRLHFLCESVGYGLPYSVQFTNPEYIADYYSGGIAILPQPDPSGLFTPDGLAATWVLCSDGEGGVAPVYSEPELLVSQVRLNAVDSYQTGG